MLVGSHRLDHSAPLAHSNHFLYVTKVSFTSAGLSLESDARNLFLVTVRLGGPVATSGYHARNALASCIFLGRPVAAE
jgi:hypothetical protein